MNLARPLPLALALLGFSAMDRAQAQNEVVVKDSPAQVEVLLQAKVHEAFAAPVDYYGDAPAAAPKVPPADAVEAPPKISETFQKRAIWIPGYWSWSTGHQDFVWTSGVWRFAPPGRRWVPGAWHRTDEGFVRSTGYWADGDPQALTYVATPPRYKGSLLLSDSLAADQLWIPGCWVPAADGQFTWREGFIAERRANWDWVPAQYVWHPQGWIFVEGYWDYPLNSRGQSFASIKLAAETYGQDRLRFESFAAIPNPAIKESANGDYVYSVDALETEHEFVSLGREEAVPVAPAAVTTVLPERPLATVRGLVHRGELTPANIEVDLIGDTAITVKTNDQGQFEFRDIPFGVYHLRAHGPVQNHIKRAYGKLIVNADVVRARIELP